MIEEFLECEVAIIGAGPAGLMAAEVLSAAGRQVHLFDAMPSVGRKFLLAGRGGLNLTHSENFEWFVSRFGARSAALEPLLQQFGPAQVRAWAEGLGVATFVGSSGRVFPVDMKAAPLLRAWLQRLRHPASGTPVAFHMRHRCLGWDGSGALVFNTPNGQRRVRAGATLLALGGGSWARLGSDGAWVRWLTERGVPVAPLQAANCGFDVASTVVGNGVAEEPTDVGGGHSGWSTYFSSRFAGQPFKTVAIHFTDRAGREFQRKGEFVATTTGLEGSLIYAAAGLLRDEISATGRATLLLDLLPDHSADQVLAAVRHPRGSRSLSSHLKSRLGLDGIKLAVLHELLSKAQMHDPVALARAIKALPVPLIAPRPIDEAISSAGGVPFDALNLGLMLTEIPGVFCAGEMLDWEAPTGGYLLTACLSSGRLAADAAHRWLD